MKYDSALNLQAEIFSRAFEYEEAPIAFSAGHRRGDVPIFVEPFAESGAFPAGSDAQSIELPPDMPRKKTVSRKLRRTYDEVRGIAIGIGAKSGKKKEHEIAVLYQDRRLKNAAIMDRIGRAAKNECRFSFIGKPRPYAANPWHRRQVLDPLRLGGSVGHARVSAGTLGCFVRRRGNGETGILSNNHILANVNEAQRMDPVWQPARKDGGSPANRIAALEGFVPMVSHGAPNFHDCAWARLDSGGRRCDRGALYDSAGIRVGTLASNTPVTAWPDVDVIKVGRTTGYTQGVVDVINVNNLTITYKHGNSYRFDGQIQIESSSKSPFARPGDSGSLIVSAAMEPVGLLFSGSAKGGFENVGYTWAHPIDTVLDALNVELLIK